MHKKINQVAATLIFGLRVCYNVAVMTKVIGLTGPIGSGKNEVAKILRRRGAFIIDVDEVGHELLTPQSEVWRKIVQFFGVKVLKTGGSISRTKLGEIVFKDKSQLEKLNQIMHPAMVQNVKEQIEAAKVEGASLIVVNAAILDKIGLTPLVDEVWLVVAPLDLRKKRLKKKGLTDQEIRARMKAQPSAAAYKKNADLIIQNHKNIASLKEKIPPF
ncbi:MAG: dephospho-CoA kinase [Candidatus Saganbacteria bacterium]|nr:dephospho-CoA kinase [Candidatus Saganbacteria bacterium]